MIEIVNLLTFVWLAGWAGHSISALMRGEHRSIHIGLLVFFGFCGVPLALDLLFGRPDYLGQPNFHRVTQDPWTNYIYCGWMALVPLLCLYGPGVRSKRVENVHLTQTSQQQPWWMRGLYLLLLAPTLCLLFAPNPALYASYAITLTHSLTPAELEFHLILVRVCTFALLAVVITILLLPRLYVFHWAGLGLVTLQIIWLYGKRSIIAVSLLSFLYALWRRGYLRGSRLPAAGFAALLLMCAATMFYQSSIRDFHLGDTAEYYNGFRLDFGRDAVIKQAIHAELNPETPILEHRGQSMLFYATIAVPRRMWPEKPWPYTVYATGAMLDIPYSDHIGWGVTTSILDEALANFGWAGCLLAPLFLGWVGRIGDGMQSPLSRPLTLLVLTLFIVLELSAFSVLFAGWCAFVLFDWRKQSMAARGGATTPVVSRVRSTAA